MCGMLVIRLSLASSMLVGPTWVGIIVELTFLLQSDKKKKTKERKGYQLFNLNNDFLLFGLLNHLDGDYPCYFSVQVALLRSS